jgi:predicted nucleotidyltransferase
VAPPAEIKAHQALTASQREAVRNLAVRHGGSNVRIFGSRARGEAEADSDVDLLVDMDASSSLLDLIAIKHDIEEELGIEVDIATEASLSRHLRDRVLREAVPV